VADAAWPSTALIASAQSGDVESVAALVSGSHPHVRRFAHSLCMSPEDAEDATQEALLILYRKIGMLRSTGALASWMFRIVRNECLRLMSRRQPVFAEVAVSSSEDEVLDRLDAERLARAIAVLPADQRRVLIMRDVQGYSGRAVANALGLSVAAMKSRLHRARATVQQLLDEGLGGDDG
jgi:RNA polymerase sigma factor (sigma-70 family)